MLAAPAIRRLHRQAVFPLTTLSFDLLKESSGSYFQVGTIADGAALPTSIPGATLPILFAREAYTGANLGAGNYELAVTESAVHGLVGSASGNISPTIA